jgi:hypothetical protein
MATLAVEPSSCHRSVSRRGGNRNNVAARRPLVAKPSAEASRFLRKVRTDAMRSSHKIRHVGDLWLASAPVDRSDLLARLPGRRPGYSVK